jgi:uncharacterized membrane protein
MVMPRAVARMCASCQRSDGRARAGGTPIARPTTPTFEQPVIHLSRAAFSLALVMLGITHLVFATAVGRMFPVGVDVPAAASIVRALAMVLVVCGALAIAGDRRDATVRTTALIAAGLLLVTTLVLHLPGALRSGTFGGRWIGVLKWTALAGGAALLADRFERSARLAMAALMVGSAVAHLKYTAIVMTLMPTWMPAQQLWAYFTAATLAAGGVGLLIPRVSRIAGQLSGAMFLGFFLLVHIPRTLAAPLQPYGWAELGESLAYAAIALMLAARTSGTTPAPHLRAIA